ncbi:hypothetical protein PoB_000711600 [Plakobranchus ocellatus]|uniref:Secreted protein n=1 Tax=Plakobranchus ocellatus TaxID=259542 RepID=A0AAV3YBQ6_9GAST|nr:hypothetical protein PoB_000711600 [Plakobranchus ocellatus]
MFGILLISCVIDHTPYTEYIRSAWATHRHYVSSICPSDFWCPDDFIPTSKRETQMLRCSRKTRKSHRGS